MIELQIYSWDCWDRLFLKLLTAFGLWSLWQALLFNCVHWTHASKLLQGFWHSLFSLKRLDWDRLLHTLLHWAILDLQLPLSDLPGLSSTIVDSILVILSDTGRSCPKTAASRIAKGNCGIFPILWVPSQSQLDCGEGCTEKLLHRRRPQLLQGSWWGRNSSAATNSGWKTVFGRFSGLGQTKVWKLGENNRLPDYQSEVCSSVLLVIIFVLLWLTALCCFLQLRCLHVDFRWCFDLQGLVLGRSSANTSRTFGIETDM